MTTLTRPPTNKGRRFPAEPLTKAEVHALLRTCSTRFHSGVRMRAMIAVLYGSGLRIAETLALYPRDVDLAEGTVRVRNGKGDKARLVGLDPYACGLVQLWLERRKALGLTRNMPIFAVYTKGREGKPLDQRYVRAALAALGARRALPRGCIPMGCVIRWRSTWLCPARRHMSSRRNLDMPRSR